jgi:tRNA U38,U39,U40 pseudouridine synthase TruA
MKICYYGSGYEGFMDQESTINTIEYELFKAFQKNLLIKYKDDFKNDDKLMIMK